MIYSKNTAACANKTFTVYMPGTKNVGLLCAIEPLSIEQLIVVRKRVPYTQ